MARGRNSGRCDITDMANQDLRWRRRLLATAILWGATLLAAPTTFAAVRTWDGGGNPDYSWQNELNWDGDTDIDANTTSPFDALQFGGAGVVANNDFPAVTGGSAVNFTGITFLSGAGAFELTGNGIYLGSAGITNNSTTTQTINFAIRYNAGAPGIAIDTASGDINFGSSGIFSGASNGAIIRKEGAGTATFGGVMTTTSDFSVQVNAGTLALSVDGALTGGTSSATIATGATLLLTGGVTGNVNRMGTITVSTGSSGVGGTFDLNGRTESALRISGSTGYIVNNNAAAASLDLSVNGFTVVYGGAIQDRVGTISVAFAQNVGRTFSGNSTYSGGTSMGIGRLNINSGGAKPADQTVTLTSGQSTFTATTLTNLIVGGKITGTGIPAGAYITAIDSGTMQVTLSAAATANGASTVSFGAYSAIGTGTLSLGGGTIDNTSGSSVTLATNNAVTIGGDIIFGGANDLNLGTGAVGLGAATRTITANGSATLSIGGVISNGSFTKSGPGTIVLSNLASTYTGTTTINAGILNVAKLADGGQTSSIGQGAATVGLLVFNGGTLQYTGSTVQSTNKLFTVSTNGGTLDASGSVLGATVSFAGTGANSGGTGGGARTLTLTGSNTGDNTLAGSLINSSGGGVVSVAKAGLGTWRMTAATAASTYSGGTNVAAGKLKVSGNLSVAGNILGTGNVSVADDATLELSTSTGIADTATLTVADGGFVTVTGSFNESVAVLVLGSTTFNTATVFNSGNNYQGYADAGEYFFGSNGTLTVVPEPGCLSLTGLAAAGLLLRRRHAVGRYSAA